MQTKELSPTGPIRTTLVSEAVASDIIERVRNDSARYELFEAFHRWRLHGVFGFNTEVLGHNHGSAARDAVTGYLKHSSYVHLVRKYFKGRCNEYRFDGSKLGFKDAPHLAVIQSAYSTLDLPPSPFSCFSPADWRYSRARKWGQWCKRTGNDLPTDYFGSTRLCRAVFKALDAIELPDESILMQLSDIRVHEARQSPRDYGAWFLRQSNSGNLIRKIRRYNGRIDHWWTRCPRVIRRASRIDSERQAEADMNASYFTLLAGQLRNQAEKKRLIELLPTFYAWLESSSDRVFASDDEQGRYERLPDDERRDTIKREAQRQLLFWLDGRLESRPLWSVLAGEFPSLAKLILQKRRQFDGASGLARWLMRLEGKTMEPAMNALLDDGVDMLLPLRDGIIVRESDVDLAAKRIRESGEKTLGFAPLVKMK